MSAKQLAYNAILLALLIICSQLTVSLPGVPLTLQTFAVGLIATILPVRSAFIVISLYLVLGALGLPVFNGFTGGMVIVLSPLGGYLLGFLVYGVVTSELLKLLGKTKLTIIGANLIGALSQLVVGSWWLGQWNVLSWETALTVGLVHSSSLGLLRYGWYC